jgi:hypothetical protein
VHSNGETFKDAVITWKECEQRDKLSMLDGYYFNSLTHCEKVSAIVNSIGLKLKRRDNKTCSNYGEIKHFPYKIKWNIGSKRFNKCFKILTVDLIPKKFVKS